MLAIIFFANVFFVYVFAMDMQIQGSSQDMSMYATETPSTQTVTTSHHPIATVEVQYNSLYISDAIDVTQYLAITTSATAVQSWNNPTASTAIQCGNTSISVSKNVIPSKILTSVSTASQYRNESVSELYQQPTLSTQTFNINQSYPSFINANVTTVWTNTSSPSGAVVTSSLIVDHSSAPTPKFSQISSSTAKPYTLAGSGVPARRNAFGISIQLLILFMQILLAQ